MLKVKKINKVVWGGGSLNCCCVLDEHDVIVPEPTIYLINLAKQGKSINTCLTYAQNLKTFFEVITDSTGDISWKDISDDMMSGYIHKYLKDIRKLDEKSSIIQHIETLRGFYEWAWQVRLLDSPRNFSFGYDHEGSSLRKQGGNKNSSLKAQYLTKDEFENILGSVSAKSTFNIERDELVLLFGYYVGLRAQETVDGRNLNTGELREIFDIAKKENRLTCELEIIGKGEKLRTIIIPPFLFEKISNFLFGRRSKVPDGQLICSKKGELLNKQFASKVLSKAKANCKKCSSKKFKNISFHSLRHTFATNLTSWCYENGLDPWVLVPERLGHENKETTLGYIYFEAILNDRLELVKKLSLSYSSYAKGKTSNKSLDN